MAQGVEGIENAPSCDARKMNTHMSHVSVRTCARECAHLATISQMTNFGFEQACACPITVSKWSVLK
jgi:hypothetical protein